MPNSITFATLDRVLVGLGFVVTTIPNSHTLYEHAESGAVLMLRLHHPNDPVDPGTLLVVRKTVVDRGLTEPAAFERLLQKNSASCSPSVAIKHRK
jgi:predicted RNA binding protein YcfA (HicA-like mRNA interferase family)